MENLNLVEYNASYAKAIADMWKKSSKGWNGEWADVTEESVLNDMEGSTSINTYLAEKDGEILGLCDFSQYLEDEGALYIKLLNVRYDMHGKGIGRTLVTKAVERTIELGWPRLDLYTWPGNSKSIPLYKRCGFFLEHRDDTTHLMNFIPYVMNTEAVKEFFEKAHWYKDLKREINMEPEGREENGFHFYEYLWEKDGSSLRMEFERKGRGLSRIETEDYVIEASLPKQELVYGRSYSLKYNIINKTEKPLNITINGMDNKNISFNFNTSIEVKNNEDIEAEFYIEELKEKINSMKTHPAVVSEILINGKRAEFKIGVMPKDPGAITLRGTDSENWNSNKECYTKVPSKLYIDIENNFDEEATFSFSLKDDENIEFLNKEFNIFMESKEKKSIELPYILKNYCFYSEEVLVTAKLKEERKINFIKRISSVFKGREGAFGGEGEDFYIIVNGGYSAKLSKVNNKIYLRAFEEYNDKTFFNLPKLGKPFTSEFTNIKPKKVQWFSEGQWIVLKATTASEKFKGIEVTTVVKLSSNGFVEHYHEVLNNSSKATSDDIYLVQGNYHGIERAILPIDNKFVQVKGSENFSIDNFNLERFTENWIFTQSYEETRGLYWNKDLKPKMDDWFISFEHNLGKIQPQVLVKTEPIRVAIGIFKDWKDFRSYVLKEKALESIRTVEDLEISINEGNPFVKESFKVKVVEHKQKFLEGEFNISMESKAIENISKCYKEEEEISEDEIAVKSNGDSSIEILKVEADLDFVIREKEKAVFLVKDNSFEEKILEEEGHKVYSLSNGVIDIKCSPTFSPALYSMVYKNHQWLESSFPIPKSRSWFNPWIGGMLYLPEDLSFRTLLEEKISSEFTSLKDSLGNQWRGIKTEFTIEHNEALKGIKIVNYYLMLPGAPVLCHTAEIVQNSGEFKSDMLLETLSFLNLDKDPKNNYMIFKDHDGKKNKYRLGRCAMEVKAKDSILYGAKELEDKIQVYNAGEKDTVVGFVNTIDSVCDIFTIKSIENNERIYGITSFYIFTDHYIENELLEDLKNIRF